VLRGKKAASSPKVANVDDYAVHESADTIAIVTGFKVNLSLTILCLTVHQES
jgi:hypothetical protein